jgi:hypothetical protein
MNGSRLTSSDNNAVFSTFAAAAVAALVLRGIFFLRPGVFTSSIIGLSDCKLNHNSRAVESQNSPLLWTGENMFEIIIEKDERMGLDLILE